MKKHESLLEIIEEEKTVLDKDIEDTIGGCAIYAIPLAVIVIVLIINWIF